MSRELSDKDLEIFKKIAPEYSIEICPGSGNSFQSILPPLSNHISKDLNDFKERLSKLSERDWDYLTELIFNGDESIGCLGWDAMDSVIFYINQYSPEKAKRISTIYELSSCGMI